MGRVNLSADRYTSMGQSILFQEPMEQRMAMEAKAGFVIGSMILKQIPYSLAPSMRPASISSFGREIMYWRKKKIVEAEQMPGRTTPAVVSMRPMPMIS